MDTDDDFDELSAGRSVQRDDNGVIRAATLTPETARTMAKARRTKEQKVEQETNELLVSMGYTTAEEADPADRILARKAAEHGNVGAMRLLLQQSSRLVRAARVAPEYSGTGPCPTCGRAEWQISEVAAAQIGAALAGRLDTEESDR
jgi:hypothetical protein